MSQLSKLYSTATAGLTAIALSNAPVAANAAPTEKNPLRLPVQSSADGCTTTAMSTMKAQKLLKLDEVWISCNIKPTDPTQPPLKAKFRCTGNLHKSFGDIIFCENFEPSTAK